MAAPEKIASKKAFRPSFGAEMAAGMLEVLDTLESGEPLEQHYRVHTLKSAELEIKTPRRYSPTEIKAVREKLNASQALLAKFLGVSTHTVSLWEQGKQNAPRMACRYLDDIQEFPELWTKRLKMAKATPAK